MDRAILEAVLNCQRLLNGAMFHFPTGPHYDRKDITLAMLSLNVLE